MKLISIAMVLSLLVMALPSCNAFVPVPTETPVRTNTIVSTLTYTLEPTVTATEIPIPQYTQTANPAFVDNQDGKQFINNKYGFTITLPSDTDIMRFNPTDDKLLSTQFPPKDLSDGGIIYTYFHVSVENQIDSCHAEFPESFDSPVKIEKVTLGNTHFIKAYTPDLDKNGVQALEYMTSRTDFCVHFLIVLFLFQDLQPGNMLPYVQGELDGIISTFQWSQP
jgi:hypothetical protein